MFTVVWNFERGSYPFLSLKLGEAVQILEENCGKLLVVSVDVVLVWHAWVWHGWVWHGWVWHGWVCGIHTPHNRDWHC